MTTSQAEWFVGAPRVHIFSNRRTRGRLIGEEASFLIPQASFRRLPHQRPVTLGKEKQSVPIAQVSDLRAPLVVEVVDVATCVDHP